MFRIGAHVSISSGYAKAVDREVDLGGNCGQIFAGSPRGWKVSRPEKDEAEKFRQKSEDRDVKPWIVHGTYLINFATPKSDLAEKSVKAVQGELDAAAALGIPYYVFHPGAHTGAGEEQGIQNIAERLSKIDIPDGVKLLLENTAGKGTTLGKTFDQLDTMVRSSDYSYSKLGICLDTCHMYAAGYDITEKQKLDDIIDDIEKVIGLDNIPFLHLNDSKHRASSEKDEHEHIGEGEIGEKGFELFINHEKLRDKPMVLETPENEKGFAWNIEKCKELRRGN
ncbi:endonuclease IV [candidate division MSBL1 archaeon SCGC-AAA259I09]|uniref:Probable endonuclease 4 n=2 Tax=candidate division MSBL1 TaxID=215777 RepID=A0A133UW22_9EURY|nr:endonuclease IV [candidate division MSBL1 archaeon SCGC-AAA259I07]KXA98394.1 endonuclease IV [candidate division MSBL1 archaeon SCGC-AAA259I09]